ncbi:MAG: carboxypeptidase-like regulatory domain-containing protein, partial [Acidobacteriota bacterium]
MKFLIRLCSRYVLCTGLLLALLAISTFAQSKPESTISGQVLLDNGQPASNALVWAYRFGGNVSQAVACDEDGNFRLSG